MKMMTAAEYAAMHHDCDEVFIRTETGALIEVWDCAIADGTDAQITLFGAFPDKLVPNDFTLYYR